MNHLDRATFEFLRENLGCAFLTYVLNSKLLINNKTTYTDLPLCKKQLEVAQELCFIVMHIKHQEVATKNRRVSGYSTLQTVNASDDTGYFNVLRSHCSGHIEWYEYKDALLEHLVNVLIHSYPCMLATFLPGITLPPVLQGNIEALFRADELSVLIEKGKSDAMIAFATSHGHTSREQFRFVTPLATFDTFFVRGVFNNCCNRMSYSLKDVVLDIVRELSEFRNLAAGRTFEYSDFHGIGGITLTDDFEIPLDSCTATIRTLDSTANPHEFGTRSSDFYLGKPGCVIEYRFKASRIDIDVTDQQNQENVGKAAFKRGRQSSAILENLFYSIIFTKQKAIKLKNVFHQSGFFFSDGSIAGDKARLGGGTLIRTNDFAEIGEWMGILGRIDQRHIHVPLDRIRRAYQRGVNQYEDATIDGFIAWEGMFSGTPETTFKIVGSICKYLYEPGERDKRFKELTKIYNKRNEIVHGNSSGGGSLGSPSEVHDKVLSIAIKCIRKLLVDDDLLPLKPSERVKKILLSS